MDAPGHPGALGAWKTAVFRVILDVLGRLWMAYWLPLLDTVRNFFAVPSTETRRLVSQFRSLHSLDRAKKRAA